MLLFNHDEKNYSKLMWSECERFRTGTEIDLNEPEYFLKSDLGRSELDLN